MSKNRYTMTRVYTLEAILSGVAERDGRVNVLLEQYYAHYFEDFDAVSLGNFAGHKWKGRRD